MTGEELRQLLTDREDQTEDPPVSWQVTNPDVDQPASLQGPLTPHEIH